jgi:hypothetical protein
MSQEAFILYLKCLWQLGEIAEPPHYPVDRIVLDELGIDEAWTKCDDPEQYEKRIEAIRSTAPRVVSRPNGRTAPGCGRGSRPPFDLA